VLKVLSAFLIGAVVGYLNSPRPEAPKDIQIINKIQPPPAVMCPEIVCETQAVKESLRQCLYLVSGLTAQISALNDEKLDHLQVIQNEHEEANYWKKKYTDFDCGE
jgi:hypothetical protein